MRRNQQVYEEFLVLAAQRGDRAALTRLVALRNPRMIAHATRVLSDATLAQDAVQDAWIDILRGLPGLREVRAFRAWSLRIVTRRCAGRIHAAIRTREMASALEPVAPNQSDAPDIVGRRALGRALAALPSTQRAAVALVYLEGLSQGECALALDIPVGTVKSRLSAARAQLQHVLKGD